MRTETGFAEEILSGGGCCPVPPVVLADPRRVDRSFVRALAPGRYHLDLLVPEMHCADCLSKLERAIGALAGVEKARANLTTRRVGIDFSEAADPDAMLAAVESTGYSARPFDAAMLDAAGADAAGRELVRAMAVAGFAAGNIMLFSVSVWSGADAATRDLFHWLSAAIAIPTVLYAGRPFFRSAFRALRAGTLNMDVPIAIGVFLATAMSLYETAAGGEHAWFDASVTLLFFLLVGRFLDHRMRDVARSAAAKLMALSARSAMRLEPDGGVSFVPIAEIAAGDRVRVAAGERLPVDGTVAEGRSDIDRSMLTGEPEPEPVAPGGKVHAGTLNLTGPLTVTVTAKSADTLLADIIRLTEAAERTDSRFVRIADRASRVYAPVVHLAALLTFAAWMLLGGGWHAALSAAVAVLIITCPCALGLAVPAVQVVAGGYLLRRGVMLKDGGALERLAAADIAVFDKTGTLTEGEPVLTEAPESCDTVWGIALSLGRASRHPLARALARAAEARQAQPAALVEVAEHPGSGVEARLGPLTVRLGRREWVGGAADSEAAGPELWLRQGDGAPLRFRFTDAPRPDAAATIAALREAGLPAVLLSGDREPTVAEAAARFGIAEWRADCRPADKAAFVAALAESGRRVLMVGDGINDAPALAGAFVSISPASGADISQAAADIVFTGRRLAPVALTRRVAVAARRTIVQNLALAIGYNAIAVPIAMAGYATPLIAAIAMSSSSLIVTANALRLPRLVRERKAAGRPARRLREATA